MYLADIKRDDRFGVSDRRSAEQRASANGKNYLDMTLADKSGSINAKMWDGTVQPPLAGASSGSRNGQRVQRTHAAARGKIAPPKAATGGYVRSSPAAA